MSAAREAAADGFWRHIRRHVRSLAPKKNRHKQAAEGAKPRYAPFYTSTRGKAAFSRFEPERRHKKQRARRGQQDRRHEREAPGTEGTTTLSAGDHHHHTGGGSLGTTGTRAQNGPDIDGSRVDAADHEGGTETTKSPTPTGKKRVAIRHAQSRRA